MSAKSLLVGILAILSLSMSFAQGGSGGVGGTGASRWGGQVLSFGQDWHAEVFFKGKDEFVCWKEDELTRQPRSYVLSRDWTTGNWAIDGVAMPGNVGPVRGAYGYAVNWTSTPQSVSAKSAGKVVILAKYEGDPSSTPPLLDVIFNGSSLASWSPTGYGIADNGVGGSETLVGENGTGVHLYHSGKRVRVFRLDGTMAKIEYWPTAESSATGAASNCGADAQWVNLAQTTRRVDMYRLGLSAGFTSKIQDGVGTYFHEDWGGTTAFEYQRAVAVPYFGEMTARGVIYNVDSSLPYYFWNASTQGTDVPLETLVSTMHFQGSVLGIDNGEFSYSGSLVPPSGRLPATNSGSYIWEIPSLETANFNAIQLYKNFPVQGESTEFIPGSWPNTRTISFQYIWDSDGAQGDAQVNTRLRLPLERGVSFGSYTEQLEPERPVGPGNSGSDPWARRGAWQELQGGEDGWVSHEDDFANLHWASVNAGWSVANELKEMGKSVRPLIPILEPVMNKVAATWLGFIAEIGEAVTPEEVQVVRSESLWRKAFFLQNIVPMPPTDDVAFMTGFDWRESRRQLFDVKLYADDVFSESGFVGQSFGKLFSPSPFYDRRQHYRVSEGPSGN